MPLGGGSGPRSGWAYSAEEAKYKKCCLPLHEAYAAEQRKAADLRNAAETPAFTDVMRALEPLFASDDDGLAELSNSAVDLAHDGEFEQALAVCARLLSDFPEVVDGLERSAMVHAKMGHHALAADYYRQALDFVNHPSRREDYEDRDYYRIQAEKQQRLADSL
jgi:tetratricopeptide (TPR) repeat protein